MVRQGFREVLVASTFILPAPGLPRLQDSHPGRLDGDLRQCGLQGRPSLVPGRGRLPIWGGGVVFGAAGEEALFSGYATHFLIP